MTETLNSADREVRPKIFVFVIGEGPLGVLCSALAEDGTVLAGHCSSSTTWARHDMGIHPDGWKRDMYSEHYPQGYEVVDLLDVDPDTDADFVAAYARWREKNPPAATPAEATTDSH